MPSGDTPDLNLLFPQRAGAPEQKLFGRYTLKRVLGRGGMGIVWMAHDDELHRYVAMKFLPDMLIRDREAVNDLKRETRRSLDLTHHHIVRIYDFTQDDNCAAIIMEYVDGETLSAMKTQQATGCFSVATITAWAAHFCEALDYAHRQARVVHRDLKPANLMVNSRGDLKVTDFGISRSMSDSMTRVSMSNTAGTLAYMSPEQALGAPPAAGDDVYAFGATVYDLLTGRPPFFRGNIQVQLETVIPPKMTNRRDELGNQGEVIPDLWEEVIAACLAKRPQDRPQTMGEIAIMLGIGVPSSSLRTTFLPGTGAAGAGTPGTTATHARTPSTDDAVTRTDAIPTVPQTTRPAAPVTLSTNYVSTPRPTALRDVIPGYIEEPAAKPTTPATTTPPPATAPTPKTAPTGPSATPPPTTSTQAKLEQSTPPPPSVSEPDPGATLIEPELVVAEPSAESMPEAPSEEVEVVGESKPAIDISVSAPPEDLQIATAGSEPIDALVEPDLEIAEEPPSEPEFIAEPEQASSPEEELQLKSDSVPAESEFPTLVGGPLISSEPESVEIEPAPEPAEQAIEEPLSEPAIEEPAPTFEADKPAVDEVAIDEAAVTQYAAPIPVPVSEPVAEEISAEPQPEPARPETSRKASFEAPISSPAQRKARPWLPIAAVAGIAAMASIWMLVPKDEQKGRVVSVPAPVAPTPDPVIAEIKTKLESARGHITSEEFDEATVLLKAVQELDASNADAAALLAQIDEEKRIKAKNAEMAEREKRANEYIQQAKLAKGRRDWAAMRTALREVRRLDFQNALIRTELDTLDNDAVTGEQQEKDAEMERQKRLAEVAEANRQKEMDAAKLRQDQEAAKAAAAAAAEESKKTSRANTEKPKEPARKSPVRPARRPESETDEPPARKPVNRRDTRPPEPEKPVSRPRSNQTPPETKPSKPPPNPNVNRGTAPGG